ncbi:Transcription initiation factor TFIID subunit 9, partial [Ascosphaera pollenicola]
KCSPGLISHLGVAKLYTDIVNNGYNIMYLTSRSTGQADTTRAYLNGVLQDGYRLPKGPVIMSPDRTMAALRREIYLRKPEVFKMACLRDILNLFQRRENPFYAGFGNRLTDALSYRSVNIPSSRIFTINSNAEVYMDLLSLNKYKSSYVSMRELVDHFFPPVATLVQEGGEEFTDFNYWRDKPLDLDDFSSTDSESDDMSVSERDVDSDDEHDDMHEEYSDEEDDVYDEEEEEEEEDEEGALASGRPSLERLDIQDDDHESASSVSGGEDDDDDDDDNVDEVSPPRRPSPEKTTSSPAVPPSPGKGSLHDHDHDHDNDHNHGFDDPLDQSG